MSQPAEADLEGKTGRVDLKEKGPAVIAKLINYLYTCDYDDCVFDSRELDSEDNNEDSRERSNSEASTPNTPKKLALNARMYVAGDICCIDRLKLLAKAKFSAALVNGWDKEDFSEVIRFIYDNTVSSDRGLRVRESLVPILVQHKEMLRSDDTFMNVIETHGEFAKDLINAWTDPNQRGSERSFRQCANCKTLYPKDYSGACTDGGSECHYYGYRFTTVYVAD
ncbi:MAG: hypothetical protein Q9226_006477 [Calogaya cf. arnoldii]